MSRNRDFEAVKWYDYTAKNPIQFILDDDQDLIFSRPGAYPIIVTQDIDRFFQNEFRVDIEFWESSDDDDMCFSKDVVRKSSFGLWMFTADELRGLGDALNAVADELDEKNRQGDNEDD